MVRSNLAGALFLVQRAAARATGRGPGNEQPRTGRPHLDADRSVFEVLVAAPPPADVIPPTLFS
jgi:hypothetical protein